MRVACRGSKRPRFQRLLMERVAGHGVQLHPWDRLDNVMFCLVFPHCMIAGMLPGVICSLFVNEAALIVHIIIASERTMFLTSRCHAGTARIIRER